MSDRAHGAGSAAGGRDTDALGHSPTPGWRAFASLYLLGIGGPVDADGVGHVDRFAWRFLVRTGAGKPDAVLAFSTMPKLMAFTRAVNTASPRAVSTEALKVATNRIAPDPGVQIDVDLGAEHFGIWLGRGTLVERIIPALEQ